MTPATAATKLTPSVTVVDSAALKASSDKAAMPDTSAGCVASASGSSAAPCGASNTPLGLRYSVLKPRADGTFEEVSPDSVFHMGDRIRLSLMSNQEGYLYIIEHGSSGKWQPLYPPPGESGRKLIAGQEYLIPGGPGEFFEFNGETGQEKLFVLLSRTPETNLDQVIEALRNQRSGAISEQIVAQLRNEVQSRDLVFTKSDDDQNASGRTAPEDRATYVVNKATNKTPDPHIVVDVVLSHR
jgi:hypothetical protein